EWWERKACWGKEFLDYAAVLTEQMGREEDETAAEPASMAAATSRRKQAESSAAASAPMIAASRVLVRPGSGALHMIPIAADAVMLAAEMLACARARVRSHNTRCIRARVHNPCRRRSRGGDGGALAAVAFE